MILYSTDFKRVTSRNIVGDTQHKYPTVKVQFFWKIGNREIKQNY